VPLSARLAELVRSTGLLHQVDGLSTDVLVSRLQLVIDRLQRDTAIAQAETEFFRQAIQAISVPIVVRDGSLVERAQSTAARSLVEGGASAEVPPERLRRLIAEVESTGRERSELVEVLGPPRRTLQVVASPFGAIGPAPDGPNVDAALQRGIVVVAQDVTYQTTSELARRDLITNVSHELQTPIGAISLLAETLIDETDPDTIRRLANRLGNESQRLSHMVNDVLALSRLESGKVSEFVECDMSEVVRQAVERVEPQANAAGLAIEVSFQFGSMVWGDAVLLTVAVENLLTNAIKYSDRGEPIEVRVAVQDRNGKRVVITSVIDQGIGIPIRERQRIFERFYRVDRARATNTGGTGIGLAMVRHIAVAHDGEISVDSLEGVGSTFTLAIPEIDHV
jgi:two-component system, OmpR family, sensor histidine kinase SenX3